jgi:hypothetical protein
MKSTKAAKSKSSDYSLKVVVAYEDADCQTIARETLERFRKRLELNEELAYSMWKFDFLNYPAFKPMAADEANEADIVVVAGHEHDHLDEAVRSWLEHWHHPSTARTQALAFIGAREDEIDCETEPAAVCNELRHLAGDKHVDFFCL